MEASETQRTTLEMALEPGLECCAKEFGLYHVSTAEPLKIWGGWSDRMQPLVLERQVHAKDRLDQDENRRAAS